MSKPRPLEGLQRALEDLDIFSREIERDPFSCFMHLEVQGGRLFSIQIPPLKKIIGIAQRIAGLTFEGEECKENVLELIQRNRALVKSFSPLIEQMENGDSQQKKFVADVKASIDRFNTAVDRIALPSQGLGSHVARFLYRGGLPVGQRLAKIELHSSASIEIQFPIPSKHDQKKRKIAFRSRSKVTGAEIEKISALCQNVMQPFKPSVQTLELYAMKVIALLEGSRLLSRSEARRLVHSTRCQSSISKDSENLTLSQKLEPLPGQIITVSAVFLRDPRTSQYTICKTDSCQLATQAWQTGFPHPIQRHGWALADALLPFGFYEQLDDKVSVANGLLPEGALAAKARALLKMKKLAFEEIKPELLGRHHQLISLICQKSGWNISHSNGIIDDFFDLLSGHSAAFELLSEANAVVMNCSATMPQEALQGISLSGNESGYTQVDVEALLNQATQEGVNQLKGQGFEPKIENYCCQLIEYLAPTLHQIIARNYSEFFSYPARKLDFFTIKIQKSLYLHLSDFLNELKHPLEQIEMKSHLLQMVDAEITIFKSV